MTRLQIELFGPLKVTRDGSPIAEPAYAKVLALLAFLAVESDRAHQRGSVAALLWPDQSENRARHSLRQALSTLRRIVAQAPSDSPLAVTRDTIGFNPDATESVDVNTFSALISATTSHQHGSVTECPACIQRLERAVALYRGPFLDGFSIPDSEAFETWTITWRQRLQNQASNALESLAGGLEHQGRIDAAIQALQRQLEMDPWQEPTHRRLMALHWQTGNRAAAIAQFERCRELLDAELGVEPDEETTTLYASIRDGVAIPTFPPEAPPRQAPAMRLPSPPNRLVGRDRELEEIEDLLSRHDCRLLTLIGPGGGGKTRLSIQVAEDHARHNLGVTCFVPLVSVRSADGVTQAIASELGLNVQADGDAARHLLDWLRERRVLLVLDNAEHLVSRLGLVSRILDEAPNVSMIVTSRERLNVSGEWIYDVHGMSMPASESSDGFEGYDAVELFTDRLRQVRAGHPLRHEERPDVIRICRLVDGMPLALELAAAWSNTATLREIADGIQQNLDFLSGSLRNQPDRHASMRAVFTSSWDMLKPGDQATYRRLSVFEDGFDLEAAEEVTDSTSASLAALINKSLLTRLPTGRYRIHPLLNQFGNELLEKRTREYTACHERHSRYFLAMLRDREDEVTGKNQRGALAAIERDLGNIRAAWRWAMDHGMISELALAAPALWHFLAIRGSMQEGATIFGAMLEAVERDASCRTDPSSTCRLALATAQMYAGGFRSGIGRYNEGIVMLSEGLDTMRELLAGRSVGLGLNMLAAAHTMKGDYDVAGEYLRESLTEFERVGDFWGMAFSLNDLGMISHLHLHDDRAREYCERSRFMFRQVGDSRGQAFAASNLGVIATHDGQYRRALRLYQEALELREESGDQWGMAASLVQLGRVSRLMGATGQARERSTRALAIAWQGSVLPVVLDALVELTTLDINDGDHDRAARAVQALVAHPALPGTVRSQVERLAEPLEIDFPAADGTGEDRWAVRTVDDIARALVG